MTTFNVIKTEFEIAGVKVHKLSRNDSVFSARNLTLSFLFVYNILSVVLHIFCDDNTFSEYIDSAYRCSGILLTGLIFWYFVFKTRALFKFINSFEKTFEQREYGLFLGLFIFHHFYFYKWINDFRSLLSRIKNHLWCNWFIFLISSEKNR